MPLILIFNRYVSNYEFKSLTINPWQIFKPQNRLIFKPAPKEEKRIIAPALLGMSKKWTSQPQVPVGIDWSNPITRGLYATIGNPQWCETKNGKVIRSGTLLPSISKEGVVLSSASSSNIATYGVNGSPESTALTLFYKIVRYGAQPDSGFGTPFFAGKVAGTADPFDYFIKDAGERVRINTSTDDDTANYWETTTNWPVNVWQTGCVTWKSGNTPVIYRNGVSQSISTSGGTLSGTLKPSTSLQINIAALRMNGAIGCLYIFNRALSAAEVTSLSNNPWQIFQPATQTSRIWSPV